MEKDDNIKLVPNTDIRFKTPNKLRRSEELEFEGTEFDYKCISVAEGDLFGSNLTEDELSNAAIYAELRLKPDTKIIMPYKASLKYKTKSHKLFFSVGISVAAIILITLFLITNTPNHPPAAKIEPSYVPIIENIQEPVIFDLPKSPHNKRVSKKKVTTRFEPDVKTYLTETLRKVETFNPIVIQSAYVENMNEIILPDIQVVYNEPNIAYAKTGSNFFSSLINIFNLRRDNVDIQIVQILKNGGELEIQTVKSGNTVITQEFDKEGNTIRTKIVAPQFLNLDIKLASK